MTIVHHTPPADSDTGGTTTLLAAVPADGVPEADAAVTTRVEAARLRLAEAEQLIPLLSDPRMAAVPSEDEDEADYKVAQELRAAERKDRLRAGLRVIERARIRQEQQDALDDMDLADERDEKLARRQQQRVTDPRLHLIDLFREQKLSTKLTSAMIIAGICWTSVTVHNNLVGAAFPAWAAGAGLGLILLWFAAFFVEALVSVPLVLVMRAQLKSAAYGDSDSLRSPGVLALEAAALTLSLALNSFPYLPVLGTWQGAGVFVSHSLAPIMIMIAVFTHEVLARASARRIAEAAEECAWLDDTRLGGDSRRVLQTMAKIERLVRDGHLEVAEDGYPSMNQMVRSKQLRAAKATLAAARDGLIMLSAARGAAQVDDEPGESGADGDLPEGETARPLSA